MQACEALRLVFKEQLHSMHHIGSTAIIGIYAKPIIDILIIVYAINAVNSLNEQLEALGYLARGSMGFPGDAISAKAVRCTTRITSMFMNWGTPKYAKTLFLETILIIINRRQPVIVN